MITNTLTVATQTQQKLPFDSAGLIRIIDKPLVNLNSKLDSVQYHINLINSKLAVLEPKGNNEALLKWVTLGVTVLGIFAGIFVFYRTKRKEYRFKKSDISGEIYRYIEELKVTNGRWVVALIRFEACSRTNTIVNGMENLDDNNKKAAEKLYKDSLATLTEANEKFSEVMSSLRKHIGMYRFFLPHKKKLELDKLMEPFLKRWSFNNNVFSQLKSVEEVNSKIVEMDTNYQQTQTPKDLKNYQAILNFIDDYESRII